ncbi:MAG: nicotinate (nicotinamide) nucleotide adenylyltransferase [Actinobacteria bacterium]|nr:nicotinate (nicotinamide) nucleotide adenylyltransferase [Actinomycetota bacterium]
MERIGLFGGTFDPVHVGHVVAAVDTHAALDLDRVLMVVAGDPWQKRDRVVAGATDRLALVEAAVADIEGVEACALEVERDGPSVTADTLVALAAPDRELFLVLGTDAVSNMPTWRRLEETRHLATLAIVERGGVGGVGPPGDGWHVEHVKIPQLDIASTDLRDRLGAGRPIDGLVPPAAVRVIRERGLYTDRR